MVNIQEITDLLTMHRTQFYASSVFATKTGHPVPSDTRAWSQILFSMIIETNGPARKKGPDFLDGSDVKAANAWLAIDKPRFNGCLKAGRKTTNESVLALDKMPYLAFVLWDNEEKTHVDRCRVWSVRTQHDEEFRYICEEWYERKHEGTIKSDNFQLHPPLNKNIDTFTNTCGNLTYPLVLDALWNVQTNTYDVRLDTDKLHNGLCKKA